MEEDKRAVNRQLGGEWIRTRNNKWQCFHPGCDQHSDRNHLLQENGIVTEIAEDGHVYVLETDFYRERFLNFVKKGTDKAFTFRGFCSRCDNNLFERIESGKTDYPRMNEKDFCAYALRPVINEIRKKEGNDEFWMKKNKLDPIPDFEVHKIRNMVNIQMLTQIAYRMLQVMYGQISNEFIFGARQLQRLEICACSIWIWPTQWETTVGELQDTIFMQPWKLIEKLDGLVTILFPCGDSSILIVGHNRSAPEFTHSCRKKFLTAPSHEIEWRLSNMLLGEIEDWIVSPRLHKKCFSLIEDHVNQAKIDSVTKMFGSSLNINFFGETPDITELLK